MHPSVDPTKPGFVSRDAHTIIVPGHDNLGY